LAGVKAGGQDLRNSYYGPVTPRRVPPKSEIRRPEIRRKSEILTWRSQNQRTGLW
jgi:hypothetical protein